MPLMGEGVERKKYIVYPEYNGKEMKQGSGIEHGDGAKYDI